MVRFPKFKSSYCSICKTHTKKKLNEYKTSEQSIKSQGKRRYDRKQKGYGGQTKPIFRKKAKTSKKTIIKLLCIVCNKNHMKNYKRSKSLEILASNSKI